VRHLAELNLDQGDLRRRTEPVRTPASPLTHEPGRRLVKPAADRDVDTNRRNRDAEGLECCVWSEAPDDQPARTSGTESDASANT
jgi:hypothetical protein